MAPRHDGASIIRCFSRARSPLAPHQFVFIIPLVYLMVYWWSPAVRSAVYHHVSFRSLPLFAPDFPNSRPTSLFLISCLRKELQIRGHGQRPDRSLEEGHGASSRDFGRLWCGLPLFHT